MSFQQDNTAPSSSRPPPPASSANPGSGAPQNQTPGHPSFRRQRASRACETCHSRKVRCDAASLGVPCTNCVAFQIECKIPPPKRKKSQANKSRDDEEQQESFIDHNGSAEGTPLPSPIGNIPRDRLTTAYNTQEGLLDIKKADDFSREQDVHNGTYAGMVKPKFVRAPIKEAGRVAYLGESSNLSLLVHDKQGTTDVVHYPLPDNVRGAKSRLNELDNVEIEILHTRGAFLLPPRGLCDELVEAFFTWVAPVVPVINRSRFMRRYGDSKNPPSLLLLQAILLAGSRVCKNPQLMDSNGSTTPAAMTFYKRAKALFDANYEDDRVTIVQSAILMGWYWEGPEDVTRNVFFWSRVATIIAQGSGMHRSVESSQLSKPDKRLWKRIWWTLFTRDRSTAVALGRPCCINIEDSDVEMLNQDDFVDDEVDRPSDYAPDPIHVQFFLNYVKLTEIMGLVLSQQYSVASKGYKQNALDLQHSDMALADWLHNCPREVFWERAHMPPAGAPSTTMQHGMVVETSYPSRNIAYQAAGMITSIVEELESHDELRFTPAFIVYSLFSALIMHVYQMRSSNSSIVTATEQRMRSCMSALKEVSKVWLVAKMVHTLFESILGNKNMEERLQKAAGRKHLRTKNPGDKGDGQKSRQGERKSQHLQPGDAGSKRKFEDVEFGYRNGHPAAQESYERSRPDTPSVTPSRDMPSAAPQQQQQQQSANMAPPNQNTTSSPKVTRNDAFMGATASASVTRDQTRATTPFGAAFPPGTPPDLFLATRNSPPISQDLFNNFQPDQLFPAEANLSIPNLSPENVHTGFIDPQLAGQMPPTPNSTVPPMQGQPYQTQSSHQQSPGFHLGRGGQANMDGTSPQMSAGASGAEQYPSSAMPTQDPTGWGAQLGEFGEQQGQGIMSDDGWSNSSMSQGPIVPTTLNVEDWFQFFGINGDLSGGAGNPSGDGSGGADGTGIGVGAF
ncbi:MAG: Transcriptional activator of fatty acid utilization [Alyxoria varia]|nr:MAG: Transcriptional activator of fatty acid utilization [Alyxoria varia]